MTPTWIPWKRVATALLAAAALCSGAACGASLEEERSDGSNFKAEEWKKTPERVRVEVQPQVTAPAGPRDPDGLLHRIGPTLHEHLSEVRVTEDDQVMLIFRSGEAIKLEAEDLGQLVLVQASDGLLWVRVRAQDFKLKLAP